MSLAAAMVQHEYEAWLERHNAAWAEYKAHQRKADALVLELAETEDKERRIELQRKQAQESSAALTAWEEALKPPCWP